VSTVIGQTGAGNSAVSPEAGQARASNAAIDAATVQTVAASALVDKGAGRIVGREGEQSRARYPDFGRLHETRRAEATAGATSGCRALAWRIIDRRV